MVSWSELTFLKYTIFHITGFCVGECLLEGTWNHCCSLDSGTYPPNSQGGSILIYYLTKFFYVLIVLITWCLVESDSSWAGYW